MTNPAPFFRRNSAKSDTPDIIEDTLPTEEGSADSTDAEASPWDEPISQDAISAGIASGETGEKNPVTADPAEISASAPETAEVATPSDAEDIETTGAEPIEADSVAAPPVLGDLDHFLESPEQFLTNEEEAAQAHVPEVEAEELAEEFATAAPETPGIADENWVPTLDIPMPPAAVATAAAPGLDTVADDDDLSDEVHAERDLEGLAPIPAPRAVNEFEPGALPGPVEVEPSAPAVKAETARPASTMQTFEEACLAIHTAELNYQYVAFGANGEPLFDTYDPDAMAGYIESLVLGPDDAAPVVRVRAVRADYWQDVILDEAA